MSPRSSAEVRQAFLDFFRVRGHQVLASGPLVPANDPTLMFANAGMVQFKDVFTGKDKRGYTRATTSQKCIRISGKHNDLENVGVTARHHTFFEMLGNFSFGDYFKQDAIRFAWDFITGTLGIPQERLVVTVFGGEGKLPADDEARALWRDVTGFGDDRIIAMGAKDNFWSMGETGPCGPCTEIHYFHGDLPADLSVFDEEPTAAGAGWTELWNLVFMQFDRSADGVLVPLPAPSIDTGAGLERMTAVCQGVRSNYDTDLLRPIVDLAAEISGKKYTGGLTPDEVSMRVIADHARTTAFLIAEGIFPDRDGRAYVLRRVMRRAIRHAHRLGIERLFLHECALRVVDVMGSAYPELQERRAMIEEITKQEEERFRRTLARGLERIDALSLSMTNGRLGGEVAFELYDTYGFPLDLLEVIGHERGFVVDAKGFEQEMEKARERSAGSKVGEKAIKDVYLNLTTSTRFVGYECEESASKIEFVIAGDQVRKELGEGSEGELIVAGDTPFYAESGGQVGDRGTITTSGGAVFEVSDTQRPVPTAIVHRGRAAKGTFKVGDAVKLTVDHALRSATRRNHSATHLLHYALRTVLGPSAVQKGSLVGPDRLRFDYSASRPLTREDIEKIEDLVNEKILLNAEIGTQLLSYDDAKKAGAIGLFEEKYGAEVRVLTMTRDSIELCGGTHATRTGDIGLFKVLSDAGLAAGVRRIEATTGGNALRFVRELEGELARTAEVLKAGRPMEAHVRAEKVVREMKEREHELEQLKRKLASGGGAKDLAADARDIGGVRVLGAIVDTADNGTLRGMADSLKDKLGPNSIVVLGATNKEGGVLLVCAVGQPLLKRFQAGAIVREIAAVVGGKGGGRPDFAQAGGTESAKLGEAVNKVYELVAAG